jgi:hypothetical protein
MNQDLSYLVDAMIEAQAPVAVFYDSITHLVEMSLVPVHQDVLDHIYLPCIIKTIGSDYYLIHEEKVVYMGHIDKEGLIETVIKDITTLPDFINFGIACRLSDRDKVAEFAASDELMLKVMRQTALGAQYLEENHGAKMLN